MKLKAELAFDRSYTTGARCLDVLDSGSADLPTASPAMLVPSDEPFVPT